MNFKKNVTGPIAFSLADISIIISTFEDTSFKLILALKGLGHAILVDFSTDQIVIELTKI